MICMVIDHPWTGFGAASGVLYPLEDLLPAEYLADQAAHSTGASYRSYTMNGHQLALPVDGATPIALYRENLIGTAEHPLPTTWQELIALAKTGEVVVAGSAAVYVAGFLHDVCDDRWRRGNALSGKDCAGRSSTGGFGTPA